MMSAVPAHAGGLVLPVHGVRSLSRGGAFIAGADDADALWQNPAGLAHAAGNGKRQLLFDLALVYQPVDYDRIDPDGNVLPKASNEQPSNPVPSLAGSLGIGDRLVIGGGLATPYQALHRYSADSPARYASVSTTGSAFVLVTVGAAYRVSDRLRVGATVQNQFSKLAWSVVMSGCPPMTTCAPEDRTFDMPVDIEQTDYLSPSGSIGLQFDASEIATLGLAIQAPLRVSANGKLTAKLPASTMFANGRITGDKASVSYTLPPAVRAGVEATFARLRVEAALAVELWQLHDEITIEPDTIQIENVAGGPYEFGPMKIDRDFGTSVAASLGAEYFGPQWMIGAGLAYETAAADPTHVSVLAVDGAKTLLAIGGGYAEDGWQIGGALSYTLVGDVSVPLAESKVDQLAPIHGEPLAVPVNAGTYKTHYIVAGLRFARRW